MSEKIFPNQHIRSNLFDNDLVRRAAKELSLDKVQQEELQRTLEEFKQKGGVTPENFNDMTNFAKENLGLDVGEDQEQDQSMGQ